MTEKNNFIDTYGLCVIILGFIWRPLQSCYLHIDGKGITPLLMVILYLITNFKRTFNNILTPGAIGFYGILALYTMINAYVKDSNLTFDKDGVYRIFYTCTFPYLYFCLALDLAKRKYNKLLIAGIIAGSLYVIIYFLNFSFSITGRAVFSVNVNQAAQYFICYLCFLILAFERNLINKSNFIIFAIMSILAILSTASRMATIVLVFITVPKLIISQIRPNLKGMMKMTLYTIISAITIIYIFTQTLVGERLLATQDAAEKHNIQTGTILDALGDRGVQYYESWPLFLDSPVTGIGLYNWVRYNSTHHICHSEFLTQYLENGLIGFILFLIFLYKLKVKTNNKVNHKKRESEYVTYTLIFYAFIASYVVLWAYDSLAYFIIYALMIAKNYHYNKNCYGK